MGFNSKTVSSLEKCFLTSDLNKFCELKSDKIFKNQKYSFQIFTSYKGEGSIAVKPVIESDIAEFITVREVVNIPSELPMYPECHEYDEIPTPGLYPDLLRPLKYGGVLRLFSNQSRALWCEINPDGKIVGEHNIKIKFMYVEPSSKGLNLTDKCVAEQNFKINIKDIALPEQKVMFTQWFYADCLADYYNVEVFSDRHFEICENFARTAVENGRNMLLLPVLSYSLDIYKGGSRTPVQLVDIFKNGNEYTFSYKNLDRWLDMCNRIGVKYYEVTAFFSQWGAESTPQVIATVDGEKKTIFGWETNPLSEEYNTFIRTFISEFILHMKKRGEDKKCWFHISDEPTPEYLEQYLKVKNSIYDLIKDYNTFDAVSEYEFYETGAIDTPVPATISIEPFIKNKVENMWCYYSGCQYEKVSNCHFAMSLSRVRSIGMQMYKYDIKGFLHWGYNFYNNQYSYDHLDPFANSDGESFAASGDTYTVYPAPDGTAWESLRAKALSEAMDDIRVMQLAETLYGKEKVICELENVVGEIAFDKCVNDSSVMLKMRNTVNEMIFEKYEK